MDTDYSPAKEMTPLLLLLAASRVVITEVMANPAGASGAHMPEDRNEFVELYNPGREAVDLEGWSLDDGDAVDRLTAWRDSALLVTDSGLVIGYSWLNPGCYAVVLDPEYTDPAAVGGYVRPYRFGAGALILTVGNTTLGDGLATTDPVTLCSPYGDTSTFGTPWNATDSLPRDPGDGISWERIDATGPDTVSNWMACRDAAGCTPGAANSASSYLDLAVTGLALVGADTVEPGHTITARVTTANLSLPDVRDCTLSVFLDYNDNGTEDRGENVACFRNWAIPGRQEAEATVAFAGPGSETDLWARLVCGQDQNPANNALRLTIRPGGTRRLFDLNLSSFSPNGDGREESLAVIYRLPESKGTLRIVVYDLRGRPVATLFSGRPADTHGKVWWGGRTSTGTEAPVGIYAVCVDYRSSRTGRTEKLPVTLLRD